jgi:hypothetical protein
MKKTMLVGAVLMLALIVGMPGFYAQQQTGSRQVCPAGRQSKRPADNRPQIRMVMEPFAQGIPEPPLQKSRTQRMWVAFIGGYRFSHAP